METRSTSLASPSSTKQTYRCWAEVDLSALKYNISQIMAALPHNFTTVCVVKSDAYGYGMLPVAQAMREVGIKHFAVATVYEGMALRQAGFTETILVLGILLAEEDPLLVRYSLTPVVSSLAEVKRFEALEKHNPLSVHIKIDTGMGRVGVLPQDATKLLQAIQSSNTLKLCGMATHYSSARTDPEYTLMQRNSFLEFLTNCKDLGITKLMIHADNTQSLIRLPQEPPFNAVRLGLLCYGHPPAASINGTDISLKPVLSLHSRILSLKDLPAGASVGYYRTHILKEPSRLALVACGYGDGIPMNLSYGGYVLVNGHKAPVCGLVAMDMFCINVNDLPNVKPGDLVTLIGSQGEETIDLNYFSEHSGRALREISCLLTQRVPRTYV